MARKYIFTLFFLFTVTSTQGFSRDSDTPPPSEAKCEALKDRIVELENAIGSLSYFPSSMRGSGIYIPTAAPYLIYRAFRYGPSRAMGRGEGPEVLGYPLHPINYIFYPVTIPIAIAGGLGGWAIGSAYKAIRTDQLQKELDELKVEYSLCVPSPN